MCNEKPRIKMDLPVEFTIDYSKDGSINIDIDVDALERTIAKAILEALEDYNKANSEDV